MKRMRLPIVVLLGTSMLILAGCGRYDLDLECRSILMTRGISDDENIQTFFCEHPDSDFSIKCDRKTVQRVKDTYFCTTRDEKKVRIRE